MSAFFGSHRWIPWAGAGMGGVLWVFDALVDALVFGEGTVWGQIMAPSAIEIWMRSLHILLAVAFGIVISRIIARQERLQEVIRSYQRVTAIGSLASGVCHEISNPLTFVRANLSQLETLWGKVIREADGGGSLPLGVSADEGAQMIEECLNGTDRIVAVVQEMRALGQSDSKRRDAIDVNELARQVVRFVESHATSISIELDTRDVPPVRGNLQHLQQVFMNLVSNAAQAVEEGGRIRVATESTHSEVVVSIEDDGAGMEPDVRDRIFDPFFTTKADGTGLGLAISAEIVRQHSGTISVESERGRGTTFRVGLPARRSGV
jgi:signal transduction histidine kinase